MTANRPWYGAAECVPASLCTETLLTPHDTLPVTVWVNRLVCPTTGSTCRSSGVHNTVGVVVGVQVGVAVGVGVFVRVGVWVAVAVGV